MKKDLTKKQESRLRDINKYLEKQKRDRQKKLAKANG
jgi:hypothetical protein